MISFPYVEFLGLAEDRVFRPMIPVTFRANGENFKSYALIDSGADYTVLPIEIAGKLNLKISDQPRYSILGAGGSTFTIYKSPTEIEHQIEKRGFRELKWKSFVYFAESGSTILLGQNGFLSNLKVTLNGKSKQVEIVQ